MGRPRHTDLEKPIVKTIRITPLQDYRLERLSGVDSLSVHEHIRRAIDGYLNALERVHALPAVNFNRESQRKRIPA